MNWDDLRFLVQLRRLGTMSATARAMGTNVATVSRRLERFSAASGQPGFIRSQEGWEPLPHMNRLLDLAEEFENRIACELNAVDSRTSKIVIGAPPFVNQAILIPQLHEFDDGGHLFNLVFSNRVLEAGLGECDLVLRGEPPEAGRMITRRIGSVIFRLYAHRDWAGEDWAGLVDAYADSRLMRMASDRFGRPPVASVDQLAHQAEVMCELRLAGALPDQLACRFPDLVPIPGAAARFETDVWCCYHASRKGDPALHHVIGWIEAAFRATRALPAMRVAPA